jgi:hypothetical protein
MTFSGQDPMATHPDSGSQEYEADPTAFFRDNDYELFRKRKRIHTC